MAHKKRARHTKKEENKINVDRLPNNINNMNNI